jgi:hypothetical protein
MADELQETGVCEPGEPQETSGTDEIGYAVADLLRNEKVADAIKSWIESAKDHKGAELKHARFMAILSGVVGLVVLSIIALLGWKQVLSGEVTAGLLGSLIGYWYGRHQAVA